MGAGARDGQEKTEVTMTRNRILKRAIPFLVCISLSLSACAVGPGEYAYDPLYGAFDFG